MTNMIGRCGSGKLGSLSAAVLIACLAWTAATQAAACPRDEALGTARVLSVDAATTPRVGLKQYPQTLPLGDHEVVLTFDDGPSTAATPKVLAALAAQCVRATFFVVGKPAQEHPTLVRRIAAAGHTIGHHTRSHRNLSGVPLDRATEEIDRGIEQVEMALQGAATHVPSTPFFRFPFFESTPATLDLLQSRGIVVFGADLWASDWRLMTPRQELKLVTDRLKRAGRGIILFHDPRAQTAAMLPAFLRYLRDNHYRVVHVVAAEPATRLGNAVKGPKSSAELER